MAKKEAASKTAPSEAIRQRRAKRDPLICSPEELSKLPGLGALIADCGTASNLIFSYCAWLFNDEPFGFKRGDVGNGEHKKLWGMCFGELDQLTGFVARIIDRHPETPRACHDIVDTLDQIFVASDDDHDELTRRLLRFRRALKRGISRLRDKQEAQPLIIVGKRRRGRGDGAKVGRGSARGSAQEGVEERARDYVSAYYLLLKHDIAANRLSEAATAGHINRKKAQPGYRDSRGKQVRKLFNKDQAVAYFRKH